MSRLCLRKRPRVCYSEYEEPDLDEYIFCTECADFVYEYCSLHGPLLVVPDNKVPPNPHPAVPPAALTIPDVFLHINYSSIPGAGLGVFATLTLPADVRFGPYAGVRTELATNDYCWQLYDSGRRPSQVVDGLQQRRANWMRYVNCARWTVCSSGAPTGCGTSTAPGGRSAAAARQLDAVRQLRQVDGLQQRRANWMRYVNCARHCSEQNLVAYQYQGEIYYRTMRIIPRGCELLVYYGGEFAARLGINTKLYNCKQYYLHDTPNVERPDCDKGLKTIDPVTSDASLQSKCNPPKDNAIFDDKGKTASVDKGKNSSQPKGKISSVDKGKTPSTGKGKTSSMANGNIKSATKYKGKNSYLDHKPQVTSKTNPSPVAKGKPRTAAKFKPPCIANNNLILTQTVPSPPKKQKSNQETVKSQINSGDVECDHCKKKFTDKSVLALHISTNHTIKNIGDGKKVIFADLSHLKCSECKYKAVSIQMLDRHSRLHDRNRRFVCEICQHRFNWKSLLLRHLNVHTKDKIFAESSEPETSSINTQTEGKQLQCQLCQYKTGNSSNLNSHIIKKHTGEKSFKCDLCDYKTAASSDLNSHIKRHTGEKSFKCDLCDYKTGDSSHLNRHIKKHTGEKSFKCDLCDYKTANSSNLNSHIKKHTGEKSFKCDLCDYKTAHRSALNSHIKKHTGENLFKCDLCDYKTAYRSTLNRHIKTHTGERPYGCDFCGQRFTQNVTLKCHLKKHMGPRLC